MVNRNNIDVDNFDMILQEANDNYYSGRFEDAANTFEHLSSMCVKMELYEDMIYFIYRALVSWSSINRADRMIKIYQRIGLFSIKLSSQLAKQVVDSSYDLFEKVEFLEIIAKNLANTGERDKREQVLIELVKHYEELLDLDNIDYIVKKGYFESIISLLEEINDPTRLKKFKSSLAEFICKRGDLMLKESNFDPELVAAQYYYEAADYYLAIEKHKKYEQLINKADKLSNL